jgi:tetratricopeptide (TPR) repeat protein
MKRKERHHLKQNPMAEFVTAAQFFVEKNARRITTVLVVIAVAAVAIVAVMAVQRQTAARADRLLAEGLVALSAEVIPTGTRGEADVPAAAQLGATGAFATESAKLNAALPKLQVAANTYPNTQAGIVARYHMAAALTTLGRHEEALTAFEEVERRAGSGSLYGQMARFGRAATYQEAGRHDEAIAIWRDIADTRDETMPPDAVLMELARAYVAKGDTEEARRTYAEIVEQHPDSIFSGEARAQLDSLAG